MQAAGLAAGASADILAAGETSHLDYLTKAQHIEGVRRPGWLLKLQGSGREQTWTRYWCYLLDDRLCFFIPESVDTDGIQYVPLDRVPMRALPRGYKPQAGVTLVADRHLNKADPNFRSAKRKDAAFSVQCGTQTHTFAAETAKEAQTWVNAITEAWEHCIRNANRGLMVSKVNEHAVAREQQLLAKNAQLEEALEGAQQEGNSAVCQEYERQLAQLRAQMAAARAGTDASATEAASLRAENARLSALVSQMHSASSLVRQPGSEDVGTGTIPEPKERELYGTGQDAYTIEIVVGNTEDITAGGDNSATLELEIVGDTTSGKHVLTETDNEGSVLQRDSVNRYTVSCPDLGLLRSLNLRLPAKSSSDGAALINEARACREGTNFWTYFPGDQWLRSTRDTQQLVLQPGMPQADGPWSEDAATMALARRRTSSLSSVQPPDPAAPVSASIAPTSLITSKRFSSFAEDGSPTATTAGRRSTTDELGLSYATTPTIRKGARRSLSSPRGSPGGLAAVAAAALISKQQQEQRRRMDWSFEEEGDSPLPPRGQDTRFNAQQSYGNPAFSPRDEAEEEPARPEPARPVESKPHGSVAYKVVLRTSDARGAGTNASAFVILHGTAAQGQRHMVFNDGSRFDRGGEDAVTLQDEELGELTAVTVGCDISAGQKSWHLDSVEVTHVSSQQQYSFPCRKWLELDSGKGFAERRLPVARAEQETVPYLLTFCTSDLPGAATDADVFITLHGSQHTSARICMPAESSDFARGQRDQFRLPLPDLGALQKLTVEHNNRGSSPAWHLDQVEVLAEQTGETTYFPCNQWLARDMGDCQTVRTLQATPTDPHDALKDYTIDIVTSDVKGAGTTACVSLRLHGDLEVSGIQHLKAYSGCQRGATDMLKFSCHDLGNISKLWIEHDGQGKEPHWHLKEVRVAWTGLDKPLLFPCNRWLSAQHGDMTTGRYLYPDSEVHRSIARYTVAVTTSDLRNAGTSARVFVELRGSEGTSPPQALDNAPTNFQRAAQDEFAWEGSAIGQLQSIRVWQDSSGSSPAWHLDMVQVTVSKASGSEAASYFPCEEWLDAEHGTQRILVPVDSDPGQQKASYIVTLHTASGGNSGTAAPVGVTVKGKSRQSGPHELQAVPGQKAALQPGQATSFSLTCKDVGQPSSLLLELDGASNRDAWQCSLVEFEHANTGDITYFPADRWIDESCGWRAELPASASDPRAALREYTVTAITSGVRHAAAQIWSQVTIELTGDRGASGPQVLLAPGGSFTPFKEDGTTVESRELGELQSVEVWAGSHARAAVAWHLDMIVVADGASGARWYFPCRSWVRLEAGLHHRLKAVRHDPAEALTPYLITVTAHPELVAAEEDASIHLDLQGSQKSSGPRILLPNFVANADGTSWTGQTELLLPELGKLTEALAGHSLTADHASWQLQMISVDETTTGKVYSFNTAYSLDETREGGCIQRRMRPAAQNLSEARRTSTSPRHDRSSFEYGMLDSWSDYGPSFLSQESTASSLTPNFPPGAEASEEQASDQWVAEVQTSTCSGAGTSARVHMVLHGQYGSSGRIPLESAGGLQRGANDLFALPPGIEQLGGLIKLTLGHDNRGTAPSWHCTHVIIRREHYGNGEATHFPVGQWFSRSMDDGRIERDFYAVADGSSSYRVSFFTSQAEESQLQQATHVAFLLTGMDASLGPVEIPKAHGSGFARGCITEYDARAEDLGEIVKLQVWLVDKSGKVRQPSWNLEKVTVKEPEGQTFTFACGECLEREQVVLFPSFDPLHVSYTVSLLTSNFEGAELLLPVQLTIKGDDASSDPLTLPAPPGSFVPGQVETFELQLPYLGALHAIAIGNPSVKMRWHLEYAIIAEQWSGTEYHFPCNRWLDRQRGDGKTVLALRAAPSWPLQQHAYTAEFFTSSAPRSGIRGCAHVELHGRTGCTGRHALQPASGGFAIGSTETCTFQAPDTGALMHLLISHGDQAAMWHLDRVRIRNTGTGQETLFLCNDTVAAGLDRTIKANAGPDTVTHLVEIFTSDLEGADSHTDMIITFDGANGQAGPYELANDDGRRFLRDAYSQYHLDLPDIGALDHVIIQQQQHVRGSAGMVGLWHLGWISVTNLSTHHTTFFPCDRFVDNRAEILEGCIPEAGYSITFSTSNRLMANTSSQVWFELIGDRAKSGVIQLTSDKSNFRRGKPDTFSFPLMPHLGTIKEMRVGVLSRGSLFAGWRLSCAAVIHLATGTVTYFPCHKWLDKSCNYMRQLVPGPPSDNPLPPPPLPPPPAAQTQAEEQDLAPVEQPLAQPSAPPPAAPRRTISNASAGAAFMPPRALAVEVQ